MFGALGLAGTALAKNKAEIVWDKVQKCRAEFSAEVARCAGGPPVFSRDLCIDIAFNEKEACEKAAAESVFLEDAPQSPSPRLTPTGKGSSPARR
jgi:hypothetical protein